jgi:hypothetical protein
MNKLDPKVVTFRNPRDEFYRGIVLAYDADGKRVKLYVLESDDIDTKESIVDFSLAQFQLDNWPSVDNPPEGAHVITDVDGNRRLARMDQREYDSWKNGGTTTTYDLMVKAKRDFGKGFYDAKTRTNIREGWNVVYTRGKYKGCQAMPGAVWSHTKEGALNMIMAFIAAGGNADSDVENDAGFADRFHAMIRLSKDNS